MNKDQLLDQQQLIFRDVYLLTFPHLFLRIVPILAILFPQQQYFGILHSIFCFVLKIFATAATTDTAKHIFYIGHPNCLLLLCTPIICRDQKILGRLHLRNWAAWSPTRREGSEPVRAYMIQRWFFTRAHSSKSTQW